MLTLEYLYVAIANEENLTEKLQQCVIPTGPIDFAGLTVEDYFTVCLALYSRSDKKILNERGYFFKTRNDQVTGVEFLNAPDGLFITALWRLDGDGKIHERKMVRKF